MKGKERKGKSIKTVGQLKIRAWQTPELNPTCHLFILFHFLMAYDLRIMFTYFYGWKQSNNDTILWYMTIMWNSNIGVHK